MANFRDFTKQTHTDVETHEDVETIAANLAARIEAAEEQHTGENDGQS